MEDDIEERRRADLATIPREICPLAALFLQITTATSCYFVPRRGDPYCETVARMLTSEKEAMVAEADITMHGRPSATRSRDKASWQRPHYDTDGSNNDSDLLALHAQ